MKKLLLSLIIFSFIIINNSNAITIDGWNIDDPDSANLFGQVGTKKLDGASNKALVLPVFIAGSSSDTQYLVTQPRIFDNQEFVYVNNANNSDSVVATIKKVSELKIYEGETYLLTIVRYGVDGEPATGDKRDGKIKSITYTKP